MTVNLLTAKQKARELIELGKQRDGYYQTDSYTTRLENMNYEALTSIIIIANSAPEILQALLDELEKK